MGMIGSGASLTIRGIDAATCTRCGECVHDCPPGLFAFVPVTSRTREGIAAESSEPSNDGATSDRAQVLAADDIPVPDRTKVADRDSKQDQALSEIPSGDSESSTGRVVFDDPLGQCIRCGHCIAVCPVNAVLFDAEESALEYPGIGKPDSIVSFDAFFAFALARRSVRRFSDAAVPDELIERIIDVMRRAPTASNRQGQEFVVITDAGRRDSLARSVLKLFALVKRLLPFRFLLMPFLSANERRLLSSRATASAIDRTIRDFERGRDRVFFHAPCVILLHSPSYGNMADCDAGIAMGHGMLAALSLGLGTCWIGFAQEAFLRVRGLASRFNVPRGNKVRGVLALGYPRVRYARVPPRKSARTVRM